MLLALLAAALGTLRLDYFHTGTAAEERFSLDEVVAEGPWPGPPSQVLDTSGSGKYRFEVREAGTGTVLYSRGFASVFGEWETTEEARTVARTLHESVRFPEPRGKATVVISKRGADGAFREAWSVEVDPAAPTVDRSGAPPWRAWPVIESGPPAEKVDVVLLGDGYTAAEMEKWHRDARRLAETLFAVPPFQDRRRDFNVWAVDTPAARSGVSRPSDGVWRRSPLGARYDAFGSERYVLSFDNKSVREAAAAAPYEFTLIVANDGKYGGGGIHNAYATVSADNAFTPYVLVHEFAHHFAGLADEYYTSSVAYAAAPAARPEPWEANVTADAQAAKWKDLLTPGVALPTPWPKEAFEKRQAELQAERRRIRAEKRPEAEMEALFRREKEEMTHLLGPAAGPVGAFEGAMYEARGYYRPQADCIMFTRDEVGFCAPCRRALERVIALYAPSGRASPR
jgi:hypothetical protein